MNLWMKFIDVQNQPFFNDKFSPKRVIQNFKNDMIFGSS
jgi:hypothetical protein